MRINNWKLFAFITILAFGFTFYTVYIAYSQGDDYYNTSYFPTYYPTWLFSTSSLQTPAFSYLPLYSIAPGAPLFSNYDSLTNPLELFNKSYAYMPEISGYQSPKLSIQKCLQERPDLDTGKCIMLQRNPTFSVSAGNSLGHIGYTLGFSPTQLSAIPTTDYLSLYFICLEGSQ